MFSRSTWQREKGKECSEGYICIYTHTCVSSMMHADSRKLMDSKRLKQEGKKRNNSQTKHWECDRSLKLDLED
jgi:hypothetical protein